RDGEYSLGQNGTGQQTTDLQAQDGDNLNQRVSERVREHNQRFFLAFCSCGTNIVLTQGFQHGGTGVSCQNSHDTTTHGKGWKNKSFPGIQATGWQPAQLNREDLNTHQTEPETRCRKAGNRNQHTNVVKDLALFDC